MSLIAATPIAFYGFIMAATWIDYIADHLVALLDFMGIVLRIPGSIMGLTILAWGNSVGDLTANITMARKGKYSGHRIPLSHSLEDTSFIIPVF